MRRLVILASLCLLLGNAKSQNEKVITPMCGFKNPSALPLSRTQQKPVLAHSSRLIDNNGVITIPVVVHAIHSSSADYVSDAAIFSQIDRLNMDFRKLNLAEIAGIPSSNWAGLPADAKIEFKLACIAPDGSSTNGIDRIVEADPRPKALGYYNGFTTWPVNTYLNIWIFNVVGIYGYGTPPWGDGNNTDGVVLDFEVVGQGNGHPLYGQGKALTHEVGHWLGLMHTFSQGLNPYGCYDDFVGDTPLQYYNHQGYCPSYPQLNDPCNSDPVDGVLFINFMDYSNDPCRYIFTNGQAARMRSYIDDPSTPDTRYGNLRNYFGFGTSPIRDYTVSACQNFTIKVSNPMCLPFTPTLTSGQGLVTIVSNTLHTITLRVNDGVACSGSFHIDITAASYNYTDLGRFNYTVSGCSNQTPNCNPPQIWPKIYEATNDYIAQPILSSGNIFYTGFPAFNPGNNFNHNGPIPSTPDGAGTLNYHISTGATTLALGHMQPVFALSNGYVQVAPSPFFTSPPVISYNTSFYNGSTGQPVTAPIPTGERILAETSTGLIMTHTPTLIKVYNSSGNLICSTAYNFGSGWIRYLFNPNSNKLYINGSPTSSNQWHVFTYDANTQSFNSPVTFMCNDERLVQITNNDKVIVNRGTNLSNALLESYDYVTNQYTALPSSIGNFSNDNFIVNRYLGNTTKDQLLVYKDNDDKLWLIDLSTSTATAKYISIVPSSSCYTYLGYGFLGSDIIISGWGIYGSVNIGGQNMYIYPGMYNYITKFDTNNDFSSRQASTTPPKTDAASVSAIALSPNPAKYSLTVTLDKAFAKGGLKYEVAIKDTWGIVKARASRYQRNFSMDIAQLPTGLYYITVTHTNGQRVSASFMKE